MQYLHVKKSLVRACMFVLIALAAFAGSAKAGLDYYKIFIGKKLIYERYLNKPLDLQSLPISAADANETLTVYYFQCNAPNKTGSSRRIILKDDAGNTVKQWNFANAEGSSTGMIIPVKELLTLQKANKNHALALYYTADGRNEGEKLVAIQVASKDVSYIYQSNTELCFANRWQVFSLIFKSLVVI